ncbi:MAG TPA: sugar transferase [Terriglobales bacterium]|nr:sugar transferase [Terriglobales bacterium]
MSAFHQLELHNSTVLQPQGRAAAPERTERHGRKSVAESVWGKVFPRPFHEHAILGEELFLHTLSVERKRSERSGTPFMLVVLRSHEVFHAGHGKGAARKFQRDVLSLTRDIDVAGWYEKDAALGIIFTEISGSDHAMATAILDRLAAAMRQSLGTEMAAKIAVSYHIFPDEPHRAEENTDRLRFYPDVPRTEAHRRSAHLMKRAVDIVGSLLAIAVLAPVFLVVGALVKLTSEGPVLFRQKRIGQGGTPFTFLKFRSMYANNDPKIHQEYVAKLIAGNASAEPGAPVFKLKNDPRITRIGRILRRTSLDELPQFFNVLKGDMSLVGPRPPLPYEVDAYDLWHRRRVLEIKPGITGLWQVNGRSKVSFDEMVRLDLKYARQWTIAMDLKILWQTPKAVFSGDGAY